MVVRKTVVRVARQQRRIVEARLAEARKGPYYGPFHTAKGAIEFLHKEIKARKSGKRQQ